MQIVAASMQGPFSAQITGSVAVGVAIEVSVEVGVVVSVGVSVLVKLGAIDAVSEGVAVDVGVAVLVAVPVGVAVGSMTVKTVVLWAKLPASSVTFNRMVVLPGPTRVPAGGLCEIVRLARVVTLSEIKPVAAKSGTAAWFPAPATTVVFGGQMTIGDSVSPTVTLNEQVVVLPQTSVAAQMTVDVPFGNVVPEVGLQTTAGAGSQRSPAVTTKLTTAEGRPGSFDTAMSTGQLMFGAIVSTTVMV